MLLSTLGDLMNMPSDNAPAHAPPKRRFRAARFGVAILIAALLIGYFVVAPLVVRHLLRGALRDVGVDVAAFDLDTLSFTTARLTRVQLDQPRWLAADTIEIRYSLRTLLRGRVKTIDAAGVRWTVRIRNRSIDWGPHIDRMTSTDGAGDLPFDRLTLKGAQIDLDMDGHVQTLAAGASISRTGVGRFEGDLTMSAPNLIWSGLDVSMPKIAAHVTVAAMSNGQRTVEGRIDFADAALRAPAQNLEILNIAAAIPVSMHGSSQEIGSFATGPIVWRGTELPSIAGSLSAVDTRVRMTIQWPVLPGATAHAEGWLELGESKPHGRLTATVPEFALFDASLIRALIPSLKEVQIGGTYALDAAVDLADGQLNPRVTLNGRRIALSSEEWPGGIEDAETSIIITGFDPLTTEPDQTIFVNRARVGEIEITNGAAAFTAQSAHDFQFQHASWNMEGTSRLGRFELEPFAVDPADLRIRSTLRCEDLDLGAWLELLSSNRVTGEGRIKGLVTFAFDADRRPAVVLGNGVLEADSAPGVIQIHDHRMIDRIISQIDAGDQEFVQQVRDRIALALRDFEYSSLRAELTPEGNDLVCEVTIQGKGRIGPDPQEFASIALNIFPFNEAVRKAVLGQSILDRME